MGIVTALEDAVRQEAYDTEQHSDEDETAQYDEILDRLARYGYLGTIGDLILLVARQRGEEETHALVSHLLQGSLNTYRGGQKRIAPRHIQEGDIIDGKAVWKAEPTPNGVMVTFKDPFKQHQQEFYSHDGYVNIVRL